MLQSHGFRVLAVSLALALLPISLSSAQVTITVMGAYPRGQASGDLLNSYIDEYNRLNPHIRIEHIPRTGSDQEAMEQIYVRTAAGVPPDIVYVPQVFLTDYVVEGIVSPVPSHLVGRIESSFLPGALPLAEYKGELYGLPAENQTQALAYNSVVFGQTGLPDEAPRTWEELRLFARKISERDGTGQVQRAGYGILDYATPMVAFLLSYSWGHGGNPVSDDLRGVNFSEPESVAAVRFLRTLYREDQTAILGVAGWADHQLGMFFAHGPWQAQGFRKVSSNFYSGLRSALPPQGTAGRVNSSYYGYLWSVTPYTDAEQEAYDFLFWLSTELTENGTTRMGNVLEELGSIPVTPDDARNQPSMREPFMQGFLSVLTQEVGTPLPAIPSWLDSFLELGRLAKLVVEGEMPAVEAMERADQFVQSNIDEYYRKLEGGNQQE